MYFECLFFFFKQKTAYEITVRDWSSDVCSSDLGALQLLPARLAGAETGHHGGQCLPPAAAGDDLWGHGTRRGNYSGAAAGHPAQRGVWSYHEQPLPPGSTTLRTLGQGYYPL